MSLVRGGRLNQQLQADWSSRVRSVARQPLAGFENTCGTPHTEHVG